MGELRQHHPSLKVSQVKELPKGDLLIIGDSMQDMLILQNETKMKAALGKNVRISLPKAYQINKSQNKCLAVKGVPTNISEADFLDFLNLNKISYAKAERLKSTKDGRVLPIFKLEISDPAKAEALISQNLMCNVTGIVYQLEEFRRPISVTQCFNCQSFGHSAKNCRSKQKCLICGESHSHKGCPNREAKKAKCANCSGPDVASYRGCPEYKKTGVLATCGEQPKILRRRCKSKPSPTDPNITDISIHCRSAHEICSNCGHSSRPTAGVLH